MSWIDNNSSIIPSWNSNGNLYPYFQLNKTIVQGLLDISGGNLILRNGGLFTQTDISSNGNLYVSKSYISGNLAIGKTTAGFPLDVNGIINATALYVNGSPYIGSQWTTNGTSIYYNSGNVGIGTTSPVSSLQVNGVISGNLYSTGGTNNNTLSFYSTSSPSTIIYYTNGIGKNGASYNTGLEIGYNYSGIYGETDFINWGGTNNGGFTFYTVNSRISGGGVSTLSRIDGSGNLYVNGSVGIGISNPSYPLSLIGGVGALTIYPNNSNTAAESCIQIRNSGTTDGSPNILKLGITGTQYNGLAYIDTTYSGVAAITPLTFRISGTEYVRLHTNGCFGIGITSPSYTLDVSGVINSSVTIRAVYFTCSGIVYTNVFSNYTLSDITITTQNSSYNVLIPYGNVGIGTSSPAVKLDVNGTIKTSGGIVIPNNGGSSLIFSASNTSTSLCSARIFGTYGTNGTDGTAYYDYNNSLYFRPFTGGNDSSNPGNIIFSYTSSITATSFNATSDYRIKENPTIITTEYYSIDNLIPYHYTNKLLKKEDYGFIAHEVQQHYPILVDGKYDDIDISGNPIYQTINYQAIIPLLVAEIKELKSVVKTQQEQINKLFEIIYKQDAI